jgi:hypothetical protein
VSQYWKSLLVVSLVSNKPIGRPTRTLDEELAALAEIGAIIRLDSDEGAGTCETVYTKPISREEAFDLSAVHGHPEVFFEDMTETERVRFLGPEVEDDRRVVQ